MILHAALYLILLTILSGGFSYAIAYARFADEIDFPKSRIRYLEWARNQIDLRPKAEVIDLAEHRRG